MTNKLEIIKYFITILFIAIMYSGVFLYLFCVGLVIGVISKPTALLNALNVFISWLPFVIICGLIVTSLDLIFMYFIRRRNNLMIYSKQRSAFSKIIHFVVKGRYKFEWPLKEQK